MSFSDAVSMDLLANFYRVYADGPAVGIHCVVSTSRAKNIPSQILDASLQTWFFQLSDIHDYSSHGIRGTNVPAAVPGRCVDPKRLRQMQVATPAVGVEEAVSMIRERFPQAPAKRDVIGQLPTWGFVGEHACRRVFSEPVAYPCGYCGGYVGGVCFRAVRG